MDRAAWYKLDNVGKFYSAQAGSANQTVFRFSATLTEDIQSELLQQAQDRAIKIYPGFNVTLRSGFFWHYLEPADSVPQVLAEELPPCSGLHSGPKSHLFRVSYFGSTISLEVSHMISDGRGTLLFFQAIIYAYIEARYGVQGLLDEEHESADELSKQTEDSFSANYEKDMAKGSHTRKILKLKGWKDQANPTYMVYHLPSAQVKSIAKEMGVSVTSLLVAAALKAIASCASKKDASKNILLNIPVDLRQHYGSTTTRNFFGLATVRFPCANADLSLDYIASAVQVQISYATELDILKMRMNQMVKLEKNPFLRIAPMFLKDLAIDFGAWVADKKVTSTFSSLGRMDFDEAVSPYLKSVNVLTSTKGMNFVACTYGDDLAIGISSIFISNRIVKAFVDQFRDLGMEAWLDIDKEAKDVDRQLRQEELEDALLQKKSSRRQRKAR